MHVQTLSSPTASRGNQPARRKGRKLHLPLALTNKPAHPLFDRAQGLSQHELRHIVAGMLG